ncbi:MAG: hypothetical protein AMXMBFR13_39930 [Phycisphaerae bacterium]
MSMPTKHGLCILAMVAFAGACDQREAPPPEFNTVMTEGGRSLRPIRLTRRDRSRLVAPAASGEQPPAERPTDAGTAAGSPIEIRDDTPEAAANTFVNILKSGSIAQLPQIVVPEQQESVQQMVAMIQPLTTAQAELQQAMEEKFPAHAFRMSTPAGVPGSLPREVTIVSVTPLTDDEAEAVLDIQAPGQPPPEALKLRRVDGKWRVEDADLAAPPPGEAEKVDGFVNAMAEAMRGVTDRINAGEFADGSAAEEALGQAVVTAIGQAMGPEAQQAMEAMFQQMREQGGTPSVTPTETPVQDSTPPADAAAQPADNSPPQREREEVDEVYSGPGMLRAR